MQIFALTYANYTQWRHFIRYVDFLHLPHLPRYVPRYDAGGGFGSLGIQNKQVILFLGTRSITRRLFAFA